MGWKTFFSLMFIIFAVFLLVFYWFINFETIEFGARNKNFNFSLNDYGADNIQFYDNMRYLDSNISYNIHKCPLQKKDSMKRAFDLISNLTILSFYPVLYNEEISVACESKNKIEDGLFIAGEGGPTNITSTSNFNIILNGGILLIKESDCERPNVGLHELLHALGFDHSSNPNNIMYNVSNCKQVIGDDITNLINELYSVPNYPDLSLENVSAVMHGKYLYVNISIRNNGLMDSGKSNLIIYADDKNIKDIDLIPIEIGYGRVITLTNLLVMQLDVKTLEIVINSSFNELNQEDNRIFLEIKKSI